MFCNNCDKRDKCTEICGLLKKHLKKDIEVSRRETLESELGISIDKIIEIVSWPEPEIELNINDWLYLIKLKPSLTTLQKRYLFIHFWQYKKKEWIANKYNVSRQNVFLIITAAKKKILDTLTKT